MKYTDEFTKGKTMFNHGDYGDLFFIVFTGKCEIFIPLDKEMTITLIELLEKILEGSDMVSVDPESQLSKMKTNIKEKGEKWCRNHYSLNKTPQLIQYRTFLKVAEKNKGESFGEVALIKNEPRSATVKAGPLSDCEMVTISRNNYE